MNKFRKKICLFMILILSVSLITACSEEKTEARTETENTIITEITEPIIEETSLDAKIVFNKPMGTYVLTSPHGNFKGIYDEILTHEGRLNSKAQDKLATSITTTPTSQTIMLNEKFEETDIIGIGISEQQQWASTIALKTNKNSMQIMSPISVYHELQLNNRYAKLQSAKEEFAYEFEELKEDGSKMIIYFRAQLQDFSDITIRYDGEKYTILSSNADIFIVELYTIGFNESEEKIETQFDYYGKEITLQVNQDGTITAERKN